DEAIAMEALGALMEIGLVVPYLSQGGFDRLAADLRERAKRSEAAAAPPIEPSEPMVDPAILRAMAEQLAMDPKDEAEALGRSMRVGAKARKADMPSLRGAASRMSGRSGIMSGSSRN